MKRYYADTTIEIDWKRLEVNNRDGVMLALDDLICELSFMFRNYVRKTEPGFYAI